MSNTITCFLVDDDLDDQEIFSLALGDIKTDVKLITANNGLDALHKIEALNTRLDFIFVDLNMPKMRGEELLEKIKLIPKLGDVPVIIYTTSSHQHDIENTLKLGAAHFLVKPSSITLLSKKLSELFNRFRKN